MSTSNIKKKILEILKTPRFLKELSSILSLSESHTIEITWTLLHEFDPCYIYMVSEEDVISIIKDACRDKDFLYTLLNNRIFVYLSKHITQLEKVLTEKASKLFKVNAFWFEITIKGLRTKHCVIAYRSNGVEFYIVCSDNLFLKVNSVDKLINALPLLSKEIDVEEIVIRIPFKSNDLRLKYKCIFTLQNIRLVFMNALFLASLLKSLEIKYCDEERPS